MEDRRNNIWDLLYADRTPKRLTMRECDYVEHFMPPGTYPHLLDLACGAGRRALELTRRGYRVVGIDINPKMIETARRAAEQSGLPTQFLTGDAAAPEYAQTIDGILLFWQSFGFFNLADQAGLFARFRPMLRSRGRLILDLCNRLYYAHSAEAETEPIPLEDTFLPWNEAVELYGILSYEEDRQFNRRRATRFDPHLSSPGDVAAVAIGHGFRLVSTSGDFSADIPATPELPRMQLVFERD